MPIYIKESDRKEIRQFFQKGAAEGYRYMILAYELISLTPYYYTTEDETDRAWREYFHPVGKSGMMMKRIFDLSHDIEMQMDAKIPLYLPAKLRQFEMEMCFGYAEIIMDGCASPDGENGENSPLVRKEAAENYGYALELGFHALAALRLGQLLLAGKEGVKKDSEKAFELFKMAASAGESEALDMLSQFYQ